ncbi:hypothetical protein [Aliamphritea ceti]|uniref:hypothetical protein n=1 Tax=Aliamphritea ceti TaxID=1524258 RepID=UPI0021C328D6|nr:hypothetical protein [Aliamphritea ceti]
MPLDSTNSHTPPSAGFSLLAKQTGKFTTIEKADYLESPLPQYYADGLPIGGRGPAISEADRNRLVKAAKCPTGSKSPDSAAKRAEFEEQQAKAIDNLKLAKMLGVGDVISKKQDVFPENYGDVFRERGTSFDLASLLTSGELKPVVREAEASEKRAFTVISHREWSGECRIRTQVEMCNQLPPEQEGDRITNTLSLSGASKIADSCQYMHLKHGGYRTFQTLTFDDAGRCRVDIRKASGPFVELNTDKFKQEVITAGVKVAGLAKREGIKPAGVRGVNQWNDHKLNADAPDATYTPVMLIDGRYYAAPTGDEGTDVTYASIQKEIGRYFDAINKMRQRGWVAKKRYPWGEVTCFEREGQSVAEKPSQVIDIKGYMAEKEMRVKRLPVRYCWVVENPTNTRGQRNPHVHILMDWRVKFSHFASWADRIESLWGQGFATLEKIKDSECAGAYMAKAAGYLSKAAGDSEQGPVKGNRYGISALSRAPGWVAEERLELGIMGHLIADTHDYFTALYGHHFAKRKQLKEQLDATPKEHRKARHKVGAALGKVRRALNRLPAIASKFQILIKSKEHADEFLAWARSADKQSGNGWLPPKASGDAWDDNKPKPTGNWLSEFQFRMHCERATRRFIGLPLKVYEACFKREQARREEQQQTLFDWYQYAEG